MIDAHSNQYSPRTFQLWVLTNEYEPYIIGGLGVVATRLTQALARDGIDLTVLARGGNTIIRETPGPQLQILRFPCNQQYYAKKKNRFKYRPIESWLTRNEYPIPDIIHIHSVEYTYLASYYKKKFDVPVIYTCHSLVALEAKSPLRDLVRIRQEKLLQLADEIVVPSNWEKNKLLQLYPSCLDKVHVIENGVEIQQSSHNASHPNRLLFVGRLIRLKGIEELLHAIALLAQQEPDVSLDIVGKGSASYLNKLKKLTRDLGIQSNVKWLGYREPRQVQLLYSSYGAVIVPSHQESFGLVALESLANGVPLISSRSGGLGDFVTADVAQVIPQVNAENIANAVQSVWTQKSLTQERVAKGLNLAMNYHWNQVAERHLLLFLATFLGKGGTQNGEQLESGERLES